MAATIALATLVASASAAFADTTIANYCTATGDYCQGIYRTPSGRIYFDFKTFALRGSMRICVTKSSRVCHSRRLRSIGHNVYRATAQWQGNWPNQGTGRYAVRWYQGSTRIGATLHFRR